MSYILFTISLTKVTTLRGRNLGIVSKVQTHYEIVVAIVSVWSKKIPIPILSSPQEYLDTTIKKRGARGRMRVDIEPHIPQEPEREKQAAADGDTVEDETTPSAFCDGKSRARPYSVSNRWRARPYPVTEQ